MFVNYLIELNGCYLNIMGRLKYETWGVNDCLNFKNKK